MGGDCDSAAVVSNSPGENDEAESRKSLNDEKPEDSELLYAGPGFTVVSPDPSQLPMPTLLLLPRYTRLS
ncbi:hypothetical protein HU200_058402 [Digitaria exilis]|uniref:Uncharacterized protein n=1 Tax=Digitaria exilis TaxID=1010633 RepID=A0A835A9Y2_9POAL|nr:hypothetical protein HU200_058402 [Digitaria exilis]